MPATLKAIRLNYGCMLNRSHASVERATDGAQKDVGDATPRPPPSDRYAIPRARLAQPVLNP